MMKSVLFCAFLISGFCLSGCSNRTTTEERVVELPAGNTNISLAVAAQIGNALASNGLAADIQKRFPNLTQENMHGLFLTWNSGNHQGKPNIFFTVGIRYTGDMPEAKAVADYCRSRLDQAILLKFAPSAKIGRIDFPQDDSALMMEYQTAIPIDNMPVLRKEVDWIWEIFKSEVDYANLKSGIIRAVHPENTFGILTQSRGFGFVFTKLPDGTWQCSEDKKKTPKSP